MRVAEGAAAGQGRRHDLGRLVVGADVDVDRAPRRRRRAHRGGPRPGEPGQRAQRPEPVDLGHQQHREGDRAGPFAAPADPPGQVAGAPEQRPDRQRPQQQRMAVEEPPEAGLLAALHAVASAQNTLFLSRGLPPATRGSEIQAHDHAKNMRLTCRSRIIGTIMRLSRPCRGLARGVDRRDRRDCKTPLRARRVRDRRALNSVPWRAPIAAVTVSIVGGSGFRLGFVP